MSPKVILISLDGATASITNSFLDTGILPSNRGLGLLRSRGVAAFGNETITPSLTAPSHIAIATGATAVNNDINANTFHLIASPFNSNISGFGAPIGGYEYGTGIDPRPDLTPTAEPLWVDLRAAGKKVVAATFPGADGINVTVPGRTPTTIIQDKSVRTVDYTVPFGAFGGQGAVGFTLNAANFSLDATQATQQLGALGVTSFSPVRVAALETIAATGITGGNNDSRPYVLQAAAIDTTNDTVTNYDTLVIYDATRGISRSTTRPSTGSAFERADAVSTPFYFEGSNNRVGAAFFVNTIAPDLSTVRLARYSANFIPRPAESPGVIANVDDINSNVGFWAPQPDFRIPQRVSPGFNAFSDAELEAIYADQVRSFTDYQARLILRAIQQNNDADLVMTYFEQPDGSGHQFLLTDPRQPSDPSNPNSIGSGQDATKVARYQRYVQIAYQAANDAVQRIIDAVGTDSNGIPNSNILVTSDHGFAPFHTAVSINNVLATIPSIRTAAGTLDTSRVRAVSSGPAVNIYINLAGREPNGTVSPTEYLTLKQQIEDALKAFRDTNLNYAPTGSTPLFDKVYSRQVTQANPTAQNIIDARGDFIGQDTGDVLALLTTGYNFDGTQNVIRKGDTSASIFSVPTFYGAHGYDPTIPEMQAIFFAAGPDIPQGTLNLARNIDIAPTIDRLLGVNPDATVNGRAINLGGSSQIQFQQTTSVRGTPRFLGQVIFPTTTTFQNTQVGGLSGITYDAANNRYYAISDDRGERTSTNTGTNPPPPANNTPPRFYTLNIDLSSGALAANGVTFTGVTNLRDTANNTFAPFALDPEGIALTRQGTVFVSSEGEVNLGAGRVANPFVNEFSVTDGRQQRTLAIPQKFLPVIDDTNNSGTINTGDTQLRGVRNNLAFESLTITPAQQYLYTATENALFQDGPAAGVGTTATSRSRIVEYDLNSGQPAGEYLYVTDPVAVTPNPTDAFATNGLVELLALDERGTLLALERSFSTGAPGTGNTIKLYEIKLEGATDISGFASLNALDATTLNAIRPVQKRLLLNFDSLGLATGLDNVEGMTLGPVLPNGRRSLILTSDNNFSGTQFTQILALELDLQDVFPNGVASGDVRQTSAVLWTRSTATGNVRFEYSTTANFSTIAGTRTANVTDTTLPNKVEVTGLTPNTTYYYRAVDAAGNTSPIGQFTTAANLGTKTGLRFGVSGDWRGELAPYPAISNADERNLAFFVEHGDTIYGDVASPALRNPNGTEQAQARTVAEYRTKQAEVYGFRNGLNTWSELRASTPIWATIDDHEVTNDFSGGLNLATANAATQALFGANSGLVNDSPLYENGLQAFQEYNPIRDEFYGATGNARTDNERKLYRNATYGSDAALFVLDNRSFRDAPLAAVTNPADQAQVGAFLAGSFNPNRTMLGRAQVNDLKRDLLRAEEQGVTWKFVMVPEPIQNLGVAAASDRFEGYAAERTEILKFIRDNDIDNVVFVAADIHGTLVNNLTYQESPTGPQIATNAFEITTGAVAYDAPFGPTVAQLARALNLIDAGTFAAYNALPVNNDADSTPNDKDDFIKQLVNAQLTPLGYDPIGLNANLAVANNQINATLIQGDYVATHTYGWSEFNIDPQTQELRVTTYGVDPYTRAQLEANPSAINNLSPRIVSEFTVRPQTDTVAPPLTRSNTNIFTIGQGFAAKIKVKLDLASVSTTTINEFGVFTVDDDAGRIGGVAPGQSGYTQAALQRAQISFSGLPNTPNNQGASRQLEFTPGQRLVFFLIQDGTSAQVLSDLTAGRTPANVLFASTFGSNAFQQARITDTGNGTFRLQWEDTPGGGDQDFNDLVVNLSTTIEPQPTTTTLQSNQQRELLDLRGFTGRMAGDFVVNSEAAYNNTVGFYTIDNADGTIGNLRPGDSGYAQAALQRRVVTTQRDTNTTFQFDGGGILAPFIIANGTVEQFLSANSSNQPGNVQGTTPVAYFAYLGANPDGFDHVRLLGDNFFGFEDLPSGGDRDFNDIVMRVNNLRNV